MVTCVGAVEVTIFVGGKNGNGWSVWVGRFEWYGWVEGVGSFPFGSLRVRMTTKGRATANTGVLTDTGA
ncbi:hypothetical protein HDF09_003819 [Edaphobacter lichenicola]|uniref:Uncharacterized protein n=1 Tax=Tunturiibacter empetritectus TaxID=3069691 RepID=A0A7W8MTQ6_9BACT|nr:hypothetical protein [Edaphobacter lichenicola]